MQEQQKPPELLRNLGLFTAIAIVVGSMIGSGIFRKPALMANQLGSPEWLIAVWIIAGIMTLFGALTNAEIAGLISATGGQYVYFNKMYNRFVGFLYGWAIFAVIQTGSIASITYVFSEYFGYFIPLPRLSPGLESFGIPIPFIGVINPFKEFGTKLLTIFIILSLTGINYFGAKLGAAIQNLFTTLKVAAIGFIIFLGFIMGSGSFSHMTQSASTMTHHGSMFAAIILAMSGAFWAYDGWNNITYLAGEVKDPQRTVPRALFIGTVIVMAIYVMTNLAYLYLLPFDQMAQSKLVASDAASKILGGVGGAFVAFAVMSSTFGTSNGTQMASARVYYAMSKEGLFFRSIGKVHPTHHTPGNSLILQGVWSSLLVLSGTFDQLTDMLIFVTWIFYALGAYGVFILRKKMPDAHRPYKTWGYPVVPALFVFFASVFVVWTLYADIAAYYRGESPLINSVMGLLLVAIGIPGYLYWNRQRPVSD
jgi:APA family basic amino acid/polyamine antiporter